MTSSGTRNLLRNSSAVGTLVLVSCININRMFPYIVWAGWIISWKSWWTLAGTFLFFLSHTVTRIKLAPAFWFVNIPETPSLSQRSISVTKAVLLKAVEWVTVIHQSIISLLQLPPRRLERSWRKFIMWVLSDEQKKSRSSCPWAKGTYKPMNMSPDLWHIHVTH